MITMSDIAELARTANDVRLRLPLRYLAVLATIYIVQTGVAAAAQPTVIYHNVMIPMRDAVRLASDIYVPSDDGMSPSSGRFPVLLLRTPYGKVNRETRPATPPVAIGALYPDPANRHGYVVVYQDVRGTFDSEGIFQPMLNEGKDGFDTIEWLRE